VHRPGSNCISSIQEINGNSIKFSLSTQTWSEFESSWLKSYIYHFSSRVVAMTTTTDLIRTIQMIS